MSSLWQLFCFPAWWLMASFPLHVLKLELGFIQKSTFEKTDFQIPVFPKKKTVKIGFRIFTKNIIKK
jgi:hypothetical protein